MKSFEYIQPSTISAASKFIRKNNKSILMGGGTDLLGLIKDRIIEPDQIVNLKNISNLDYINYSPGDGIKIGSQTKLVDLINNKIVKEKYNLLYQSLIEIATPQLRNMGTIGGNICQRPRCFYFRNEDFDCIRKGGDTCFALTGNNKYHCIVGGGPCYIVHASDSAVALLALDAKFKISDGKNDKIVNASEFFVLPEVDDMKENILKEGEILTEIIIPDKAKNNYARYIKIKERGAWDFALMSIAGNINVSGNKIVNANISFGGVAPIPWIDQSLNNKLEGLELSENNIMKITSGLFNDAEALEMNQYKIPMVKNLVKKLLIEIEK